MLVKNTQPAFLSQIDKLIQGSTQNISFFSREDKIQELHFELTFRCSSRCIMCDLWRKNQKYPQLRKKELSLREIKNFVKSAKSLRGINKIILSGGEPFLREDLPEICGFFSQNYPGISIGILSSLSDTEKVLRQTERIFKKYSPESLWFGSSVDGIGATHDLVRGREGAFKRLFGTINQLRRHFPQISCSLTFTINPKNYRELFLAYERAEELGCWFGAQFVIQKQDTEKFIWRKKDYRIIEEQIGKIVNKLLKRGSLGEVIFWRYLVKHARQPQRYLKQCFMGRRIALLNPWGEVYLCPKYREMKFGNIRERSFDELWQSKRAERIRKFVAEEKCSCWLYCSVMPVLEEILNKSSQFTVDSEERQKLA